MNKRYIHVAVGVIVNAHRHVLIAKRPLHVHQGGLWEFPGGKLEESETVHQALVRELKEELGIEVFSSAPLIQIRHDYGDKAVLLDVHCVNEFSGEPVGTEGQEIRWVSPHELHQYSFPAANKPIIDAITLPSRLAITGEAHDLDTWLAKTKRLIETFSGGIVLRHQLLRQQDSAASLIAKFSTRLKARASHSGVVMLNTSVDVYKALTNEFSDLPLHLHLNRWDIRSALDLEYYLPQGVVVGASCHSRDELQMAASLGVSYALLSPVKTTKSHPDANPLGWESFRHLVQQANFPVYALGGVSEADIVDAQAAGGQGIASISAFWV